MVPFMSASPSAIVADSTVLQRLVGARTDLRRWYLGSRRTLPWREQPTPYRVWVSEIMLQQTQVATVIPYFERFVDAFPDVGTLASAPEEQVITHWAGLGYYRRCRYLHAAAKVVMERFNGEIPGDVASLLSLPGVGRYTAGAIASIAFQRPAPVLDGNVTRVISRLLALEMRTDKSRGQRILWDTAEQWVDPEDPSSHNQALMELGATVCSPRQPHCSVCPMGTECKAFALGTQERYPLKARRKPPREVRGVGALVRDANGAVLLARRPEGGLLGGLWELPGELLAEGACPEDALRVALHGRMGLKAEVGGHLAAVKHVFTHRRLTLDVFNVPRFRGSPRSDYYATWRWVDGDFEGMPLSRLTQKVLLALGYLNG